MYAFSPLTRCGRRSGSAELGLPGSAAPLTMSAPRARRAVARRPGTHVCSRRAARARARPGRAAARRRRPRPARRRGPAAEAAAISSCHMYAPVVEHARVGLPLVDHEVRRVVVAVGRGCRGLAASGRGRDSASASNFSEAAPAAVAADLRFELATCAPRRRRRRSPPQDPADLARDVLRVARFRRAARGGRREREVRARPRGGPRPSRGGATIVARPKAGPRARAPRTRLDAEVVLRALTRDARTARGRLLAPGTRRPPRSRGARERARVSRWRRPHVDETPALGRVDAAAGAAASVLASARAAGRARARAAGGRGRGRARASAREEREPRAAPPRAR